MSNNSLLATALMLRGTPNPVSSTPETVSPVTLSSDWSRVNRLLFLTALSFVGSAGNIFMISSVIVEDNLKKRGNSFLVSLALGDILITGIVIPTSAIVILAEITDSSLFVCNFQWFLTLVSCLVSVLTVLIIALENYSRLCLSSECYDRLTPRKITFTIIFIWILSCTAVSIQKFFHLGPDYCSGNIQGLSHNQLVAAMSLVLIPSILTLICYIFIFIRVRMNRSTPGFRPPITFALDYDLMKTNLFAFVFFLMFWAPFASVLAFGSVQAVTQKLLYTMGWFALSKSCFLNFLYCFTNRNFRDAYISLFHYCCCKTISFSKRSREPVRPLGDVRVHIIPGYNMYSYTSPQRARDSNKSSNKRHTGRSTSRGSSREVYEL